MRFKAQILVFIMSVKVKNGIVQITNVSPSATSDQLRTLFGHVGVLDEVVVYPSDGKEELSSKVFYSLFTNVGLLYSI